MDACYIQRTFDVDQWEAKLAYLTVFVQVVGTRPPVQLEEARRAIAEHFQLQESSLEINRVAPPEDFLLRVPNHGALIRVLQGDRSVITPAFKLLLKPWSRLANADSGELVHHKVQIDMEGIPLHVWNRATAEELLRPFCLLESVHPDTLERRDLSVFRIVARTTRPECIPDSRTLVVPEPAGDEAPSLLMQRTLKYNVRLCVRRLLLRLPQDSPPCSPPRAPPSEPDSEFDSPVENPKRRRRGRVRQRRALQREDTPVPADSGTSRHGSGATASVERRRASGTEPNVENPTCPAAFNES